MVSLCICIVYLRYAFQRIPDIFFFQHTDLVYICYILWGVFPMYLHCIRSLHFLRAVSNSFLDSARLHPLHILGWFPYVFALYTFVTLFRGFLIFFFFNIQILYTSVTSYGMFFLYICIVYVRYAFQRIPDIFFFSTYRSCIHLLHLMGCFPYVFALYTFVTLFESCILFFFRFSSSTSVTYTWVVSLCICIVYVRYAFQRIPDIFFFNIQILYTSVTSYGMFFLYISIVYVRYTF